MGNSNYNGACQRGFPGNFRADQWRSDVSLNKQKRVPSASVYSYLSDSIGSRRAAFHAGNSPKTMPMPTLAKNPSGGAHQGT